LFQPVIVQGGKLLKKLVLFRETILHLQHDMSRVRGGTTATTCSNWETCVAEMTGPSRCRNFCTNPV
jgi:hypothetical protein